MTAHELRDLAQRAASLSASQRIAAEDSVTQVTSGLGLNSEQLHRVKTMTNRDLLTRVKQSSDPHLWGQRFITAKGAQIPSPSDDSPGTAMKISSVAPDTVVTKSTTPAGKSHPSDKDIEFQYESLLSLASGSEKDREGSASQRETKDRTSSGTSLSEILERELSPYKTPKVSSPWELVPSYDEDLAAARREVHTGQLFDEIFSPESRSRLAEEEFRKSSEASRHQGKETAEAIFAETRAAATRAGAYALETELAAEEALFKLSEALQVVVEEVGLTPGEVLYVTREALREFAEPARDLVFSKASAALMETYGIEPEAVLGEARDGEGNLDVCRIKVSQAQMQVRFALEEINPSAPSVVAAREAAEAVTLHLAAEGARRDLEAKCSRYRDAMKDLL